MNQPDPEFLRPLPHSAEAEQAVLGGLMLDNEAWDKISDLLSADALYRYDHRLIFQHIQRLIDRNQPADVITVFESLSGANKVDEVGGLAYLNDLVQSTPSAANIRRHAEIVRDHALRRQLLSALSECEEAVIGGRDVKTADLVDQVQTKITALGGQQKHSAGPVLVADALRDYIDALDERYHSGSDSAALPTGIADLDLLLGGGLKPGTLTVIGGRPSDGKSALGQNAMLPALERGGAVLHFSMEQPTAEFTERVLAQQSQIPIDRLAAGSLTEADWPRLTQAIAKTSDFRLHLDETPSLTLWDVRTRARRLWRQEKGLALISVDYLQLMQGSEENQNERLEAIANGLKALAKELEVPIIAMSQLNRGTGTDRRPNMGSLRASGGIEQAADIVILLNREDGAADYRELIVAKNRQGRIGSVGVRFEGELMQFSEWTGPAPKRSGSKPRLMPASFDD